MTHQINNDRQQAVLEHAQRQREEVKEKRMADDIRKMDDADDAADDLVRCNANVAAMLRDRRGNAASIEARLRECAEPMSLSCKCEELMLQAADRIAKLEVLHVAVTNHIAMYDGTIDEFNMTATGIRDALAALE